MKAKLLKLAGATDDNRMLDWLVLAAGIVAFSSGVAMALLG